MIYADSKREGERAAFAAGERLGVEVVAVNPAYVLGVPVNRALPGETSTRIVGNYLRGRLPAIVDAYTNIVDVEDVADGHLLAAESGRPGERYILGGENLRWSEVMRAGRRARRTARAADRASAGDRRRRETAGRLRDPGLPLEGIRLMAPDWRYSSAKAKRELGYAPRSARETLAAHGRLVPRADRERPPRPRRPRLVRPDDRRRAARRPAAAARAAEGRRAGGRPKDRPLGR